MRRGSKWILFVLCFVLLCEGCASPINVVKSDGSKSNYVKAKKIESALIEPDNYIGKWIKLYGQITSGPKVDGADGYMVCYKGQDNRYFFVSTTNTNFKVGDYVKVDAKINNIVTRKNAFGDDLPVAELNEAKITKTTYDKVEAPAYQTIKPKNGSKKLDGVKFEVQKVEYAESETRVYIKVTNKTDYELYCASAYTIVQQGDTVINPNTSESIIEREGYDQIASSIDPGDSSSGIVLFSVISPEKATQVITSIYDSLGQEYDFTIDVN
ncbi:hypothetical protein [Absicoccus intestinalis]|uniref:DUF4352 domain-containing protein n=1 Tax=Absicoccus intestinalis TaxID=2926319 RepID=A0ABU4WNZ7_9FIRM|nr:hypothetical protein [Absicoccus sp. CLA-KB-P134]MDX8418282.1 hypothetical protein [Absicoccus sp. CLA-KB-P134]